MSNLNTNFDESVPEPRFKKGESCIEIVVEEKDNQYLLTVVCIKKKKVFITVNIHIFHSSDGYCYEDGL